MSLPIEGRKYSSPGRSVLRPQHGDPSGLTWLNTWSPAGGAVVEPRKVAPEEGVAGGSLQPERVCAWDPLPFHSPFLEHRRALVSVFCFVFVVVSRFLCRLHLPN